jgi:outer membrane receptor protein involved in Fe transport
MIHLKIKPLKWFDIRLAYTETVSRPNFGKMSPKYYRSSEYNIIQGDLYLKPQTNYNYDVYLSFYTNKLGLFTAGAFYKKMEDQVLDYRVTIVDPEEYNLPPAYKNKTMEQPVNNQWPGYITGVELDWQTQFSFLPKPFNGITLNANLALGYELGGFSGRISAYYQSATITTAQASNKSIDEDKDALLRIDAQFSQKVRKVKGLTFYLNMNNLTNIPDRSILTHHRDRVSSEERYGFSGDVGVRYQF